MKRIAHRGGRPENTMEAFRRARRWHAIETDVHLTSDGVPVCVHDPIEGTFEELGLPSLEEALSLGGRWMVEIKGEDEAVIEAVIRVIPEETEVIMGSLLPRMCEAIAQLWPKERLIGIVEREADLETHLAHAPRFLALNWPLATRERVAHLQRDHEVWAWTVNSPKEAKHLDTLGVGIITDLPEALS